MGRINVDLLDKTLAAIENNQDRWNQLLWGEAPVDVLDRMSEDEFLKLVAEDPLNPACGTAYCFAGHAAIQADWKPVFKIAHDDEACDDRNPSKVYEIEMVEVRKGNVTKYVADVAEEELGLTFTERDCLFAAGNTLEDLRNMVAYARINDQVPDRYVARKWALTRKDA